MKKSQFVLFLSLFLLLIPSFTSQMQDSPLPGWLTVERCVGEFNYPSQRPDQWDFRGVIHTIDYEGVHALRADAPAPYFLGIVSGEAYADHGAVSPNGKYFAYTIGSSSPGNDTDRIYGEDYIVINDTSPQSEGKGKRVTIDYISYSYGTTSLPIIEWMDNATFIHAGNAFNVMGEPVEWNRSVDPYTLTKSSPDGTRMFSKVRDDQFEIIGYNLYDIENDRIITEGLPFEWFQWLEDSSKGYFISFDSLFTITEMDRNGILKEIYSGVTDDVFYLTFSPNGHRFILVDKYKNLYLGDVEGQVLYNLCTQTKGLFFMDLFFWNGFVVWAPDSQSIAFIVDGYPVLLNTDTLETTVLQYQTAHVMSWYPINEGDRIPEPTPIVTPTQAVIITATPVPTITTTPDTSPCTLTTLLGINLRQGPGRDYEVLGSRAEGDTLSADGQAKDGEGFTWWRLVNADVDSGLWIREDATRETGGCVNLPLVEITP